MRLITLQQAHDQWQETIKPAVIKQYGEDDTMALSESWSDYTDALCKDGELTPLQYDQAPAWDEDMPDDDYEHCAESLGIADDKAEQLRQLADLT